MINVVTQMTSYFFDYGPSVVGVLEFDDKRSGVLAGERAAVEDDLHVHGRRHGRYGHDARAAGVSNLAGQ